MNKNDDYDMASGYIRTALKKGPIRTALIIGVALLFFMILKPWVQIGAGERGIVLNFGLHPIFRK